MSANAKHSSLSIEHYTPENYVAAAREVLGGIELDPASSELANQTVKAERFYTKKDDALRRACDWTSRSVWCNPPGKEKGEADSLAKPFWFRLAKEWMERRVGSAIFLAFSIELLQTTQNEPPGPLPLDFPFCIPRERIPFNIATERRQTALFGVEEGGPAEGVVSGDSPTHANVLVLLPPLGEGTAGAEMTRSFQRVFARFGKVVVP